MTDEALSQLAFASRSTDEADLDLPVAAALEALGAGGSVVLAGGLGSGGTGLLVTAADAVDAQAVRFYLRHTSGHLRVAMAPERSAALDGLSGGKSLGRAATLSVDARSLESASGISVADRAVTVRALAGSALTSADLRVPGCVFPVAVERVGVVRAPYPEEAAVDLARMAGRAPVALVAEVLDEHGGQAGRADLDAFAAAERLGVLSVGALLRYRWRHEDLVQQVNSARLPTEWGVFTCYGYVSVVDGRSHLAMVFGAIGDGENVLARVHSECLTGDVFGSLRCDCGVQLDAALAAVAREGRGVVVYTRGQEGRGIGLMSKLKAYELQDTGLDTVDANVALGLPVDGRDYGVGAKILRDLGVRSLRLITNNPEKIRALASLGLPARERVSSVSAPTPQNTAYLRAKQERMGHLLACGELST